MTIYNSGLQYQSLLVSPYPNLYRLPIRPWIELWHLQLAFESITASSPVIWEIYEAVLKGVNTLRPRQNGRHFPDDIFKCCFLNENIWISIKFLLKFVPKGPINNILALVQIMAWCWPGDKPLSEPTLVSYWRIYASLGTQWFKCIGQRQCGWRFADNIFNCILLK